MRHAQDRRLRLSSRAVLAAAIATTAFAAHAAQNLATVARSGDLDTVRRELAAGADPNATENDGTSALLWATYHSASDLAKELLAKGADPNVANGFGMTPLLQASRNGDVATLRALLDAGADLAQASRDGETPLMAAARAGSEPCVALLLERGADPNAAESMDEQTALMWATAEGHHAIVDRLLAAGADPNRKARVSELSTRSMRTDFPTGGFAALHWAARNGDEALVRKLVAAGADVNLQNGDGASPLMLAIVNDRFDLAGTLLELGADANEGSLYQAIEMRDAPTDWRARDGSRLRANHPNTLTALDLVRRLLDAGADPNKPYSGQVHSASMCCDTKGYGTPLFRAAVAADVETLRLLVAHGADVEWTPKRVPGMPAMPFGDYTGLTPLMAAINGGKGLLMAGGPGDIREGKIGEFREPGDRDAGNAVKVLLEAGANPNAKNEAGDTPLHVAAYNGRLGPLRELVAAGADITLRDAAGKTALELVDTMPPRTLNEIAAMVGLFDDGASPAETAAYFRELLAARK